MFCCCCCADSLVLHLQLVHDGHLLGGSGQHDTDANPQERLCSIQQGRRPRRNGRQSSFIKPSSVSTLSITASLSYFPCGHFRLAMSEISSLFCHRSATWVTNTVGSRCTATSSAQQLIPCSSRHSSEVATKWRQSRFASSSSLSSANSTPSTSKQR